MRQQEVDSFVKVNKALVQLGKNEICYSCLKEETKSVYKAQSFSMETAFPKKEMLMRFRPSLIDMNEYQFSKESIRTLTQDQGNRIKREDKEKFDYLKKFTRKGDNQS